MSREFATTLLRLNLVDLIDQAVDPSAGGGVAAAIGSLFLRSGTGQLWLKTGAGNTAWTQFQQSFAWYSVKDFGAIGSGAVDDTASVQAAINACNAAGGGVVYFPFGTYAVTQITMAGMANVQLRGAGTASVIKWVWNAATAAGSMITVSAGASRIRFSQIALDGSGLTNPNAGRDNHLVRVGTGAGGGVIEVDFFQVACKGMVAASGDGIHAFGAAGNLASRVRVDDCNFDGCSRFSVCFRQSVVNSWITNCYATNCDTEIAVVTTVDTNINAIQIKGNILDHTSGTIQHALRVEGGATTFVTAAVVSDNVILNGFATANNVQYLTWQDNIQTSGAYAVADAVLRIFGAIADSSFLGNIIDRASTASAGPCVTIEKATGAPVRFAVSRNTLINEVATAGFIKVVDAVGFVIAGNSCRGTNAGATAVDAIDVQAVTVNVDDGIIGPGNLITAAAGTYRSAIHLLANGANIVNLSPTGNQADQIDVGIRHEVGGGGGTIAAQLMEGGNNWNATTADFANVGVTVYPRIGMNAGTFGPQYFAGDGTPEANVTARASSLYSRRDGGQATAIYYKETGSAAVGWLGIGGTNLPFGTNDTTTASTAVFMAPGFITTAVATELQQPMTRPGTIRNLRVQVATAGTGAQTVTFTVRKNGVDTAITCTISNTATGATSDLTHSVTVVAGDLISESIVKAAGVAAGQSGVISNLELV